ncbi:MAG: glycosyltransferase family 4 protein [Vulcanimicrobiaceae bacterium]
MPIVLTNNFPPDYGGIQTYIARLAAEICAANQPVVVVAPKAKGAAAYDASLPYRVVRYPSFGRLPFAKALEALAMSVAFARALGSMKARATIASAWWPGGIIAALLPQRLRGPLVVIAHGNEIKPSEGGLRRRLMHFVYRRARVVAANSSYTRDLLLAGGVGGNVRVMRCGVDARSVPRALAAEPTILSVGRLIERKGIDRTIDAVAELVAGFPNVRYEIVGNGPDRARLESRVRELALERHVAFLGSVSDEEMLAAYGRAWCFALPARRVRDDVEGFGIVYLEAAMAQLVSIGGRESGAVDAIAAGETGFLVDGSDSKEIAAALRTLLADRELATRMGERARVRAVADFRWAFVARDILSALST